MADYTVRWETDIEADSPFEAAKKAAAMLRGTAHEFEVDNGEGTVTAFDLAEGTHWIVRCVPIHTHDFVGDEDTCTVYRDCPVTWAQQRAADSRKKES